MYFWANSTRSKTLPTHRMETGSIVFDTEKSSEKQQIGTEKSSEKILRIMAEQPTITTAILAKEIGISTRAIDKQIAKLKLSDGYDV